MYTQQLHFRDHALILAVIVQWGKNVKFSVLCYSLIGTNERSCYTHLLTSYKQRSVQKRSWNVQELDGFIDNDISGIREIYPIYRLA